MSMRAGTLFLPHVSTLQYGAVHPRNTYYVLYAQYCMSALGLGYEGMEAALDTVLYSSIYFGNLRPTHTTRFRIILYVRTRLPTQYR